MPSMWTAALNCTSGLPHESEVCGSKFERFQFHISTCQDDVLRRLAEVWNAHRAVQNSTILKRGQGPFQLGLFINGDIIEGLWKGLCCSWHSHVFLFHSMLRVPLRFDYKATGGSVGLVRQILSKRAVNGWRRSCFSSLLCPPPHFLWVWREWKMRHDCVWCVFYLFLFTLSFVQPGSAKVEDDFDSLHERNCQ